MKQVLWVAIVAGSIGCGGGSGVDADGDTISDGDEGATSINTDGDEFADYLDLDSDGDGIPDAAEAGDDLLETPPVDTDGDEVPDFLDGDSDGDLISDTHELDADFLLVDTDGDGVPDTRDPDSDDDGIDDAFEAGDPSLETSPGDRDGDGTPNFRDLDSDGDCIPDALEAGAGPAGPRDSDTDGVADFLDPDSDNDGLLDADEDLNCNGVRDQGESSATSDDSDADGTPDLIEVVAGSDPGDPTSNIPDTDFYFVLPYMGPGQEAPLDFSTTLRQADIFFSVDTTGSFQEEIDAIQTALETTIVPGVTAIIPDAGFGVGRFEDLPLSPFGLAGDKPFELLQPITTDTGMVSAGLAALAPATGGLDVPESGMEALYQWATGLGLPAFGYPPFAPAGIGGVGFRADSLPIIVQITDARSHDSMDYPAAAGTHTYDETVSALTQLGIRVIGVDSLENQGTMNDPRAELEGLAIDTKAFVPPDGSDSCATGVDGALRPAVDPGTGVLTCPLVFDVLADGTGLGDLIVDAIGQLANLGTLDISTALMGEIEGLLGEALPSNSTTADFITAITPVAPPPNGSMIDGDVFRNVTTGSMVTFNVEAFNDFVPGTSQNQLFGVEINILGDQVTTLDIRRVFIIVPKQQIVVQ
jgi:hypothetical protein